MLCRLTIGSVVDAKAQCAPASLTCLAWQWTSPSSALNNCPTAFKASLFESTATFNLPPSVVDPGSGLEATLLTVTISQVTGLPFGFGVQFNNPDGVYQPQNGEYYGCSVVCERPW